MTFKPYPNYKASGVEWLGEVPEGWSVEPLKRIVALTNEKIQAKDTPGGYMGMENIESWSGKFVESASEFNAEGQSNRFGVGDVLFGKLRPYLAKAWLSDRTGVCSSELLVLRPRKIVAQYLLHQVLNRDFVTLVDSSTYGSKMPRASWDYIGSIELPSPPICDQVTIAAFLDRETAKIDTLIAKQEAMIGLLQEKRQAVISHTVTKGLDPSVPMKTSGVEWLGDVPEHWEITRLGWITDEINDINHQMPVAVENGVPFLSAKDLLDSGVLNFDVNVKQISEDDFVTLSKKIQPRRNDIIYSRIGARLGKARLVETDLRFLVSYSCCVVRVNPAVAVSSFICMLLDTDLVLTEAKARTNGIGVPDLGLDEIARFPVPLPPIAEQATLVNFLKEETAKFSTLIAKAQQAITLQKEHRTALISAAVTGKIDVRNQAEERKAA